MNSPADAEISAVESAALAQERLSARALPRPATPLLQIVFWALIGAAAFHAAYAFPNAGFLTVVYVFALLQLARSDPWRRAAHAGLAVGLLIAVWRLGFFWRIFGPGAIALWWIYAFWIGLFVALARLCLREFDGNRGWFLVPFVWVGLEYFRSELYYLRFSWLNPGYAFSGALGQVPLRDAGMYGVGFLLAAIATAAAFVWSKSRMRSMGLMLAGAGAIWVWGAMQATPQGDGRVVHVAGVQMEFPTEGEVRLRLNDLVRKFPETELIVLSEYTFGEPVPPKVKQWCREHARYLVVGGKDPAPGGDFYDTAFVIGPTGEIVFRQVKSVPIQFFKDGRPAPEQKLWASPWGKIGICICYDLSYTRVTDRLIAQGAGALIVPTMDVVDWGESQHEMHARVAPVRAAEYGVPIFRVASSGISQAVDREGRVMATAPCPGDGAMIAGTITVGGGGRRPLDRWLGPVGTGVTLLVAAWLVIRRLGTKTEIRTQDSEILNKSELQSPSTKPTRERVPAVQNLAEEREAKC